MVADRGFGFLALEGMPGKVFFHVTASLSRQTDYAMLAEGDKVLCQIGSTPREPAKRSAVTWAPLADWDWPEYGLPSSQETVDSIRLEVLRELHPKKLDYAVTAKWYKNQWDGTPPSDLFDPVLKLAWLERLVPLSPDALKALDLPTLLSESPLAFAKQLDPDSSACSVSTLLSTFSPAQLARIGAPKIEWLASSWSEPPETAGAPVKLEDAQKADVLEWFLEHHRGAYADLDSAVLAGNRKFEAILAKRLLDRGETLPKALVSWLRMLADRGWMQKQDFDSLVNRDPVLAISLFPSLSPSTQRALRASWKKNKAPLECALDADSALGSDILMRSALAIDLETDGEQTWEIGSAGHDSCTRLHDAALGTSLENALVTLAAQLNEAELLVGHNILGWDWPILSGLAPDLAMPLAWDTLLVQFLLEPQARSHALGSNHHAETDAKAALELFARQLDLIALGLKTKILLGRFQSPEALITALIAYLPEGLSLARPAPAFLDAADPSIPMLMQLNSIHEVDWVPGVQVVPATADERLDPAYWQIDIARLYDALTDDQRHTPNALVLLAVGSRAMQQNVAVRRNMVPQWLIEKSPWLVTAIDRACFVPAGTTAIRVAPLPSSPRWWTDVATARLQAVLPCNAALVVNRRILTGEETLQLSAPANIALLEVPGYDGARWALQDPAARVLEVGGGWRGFDVIAIPETFEIFQQRPSPPRTRPHLAMRQFPTLFPGSQAQGGYWMGQLASLRAICEGGTVPVFLLTSTTSRTMIDILVTACAEVGIAEIKPAHRSRREHLLRAVTRGCVIVDSIDQWRDWQSIAEDAGVPLQPVVEALPLEEWYALSEVENQSQTDATVQGPLAISNIELLEDLQKLIGFWLGPWLEESGLTESPLAPIILDPRLESAAYELRAQLDRMPITLQDWSADLRERLENVFAAFHVQREDAPSDFASMERFLVENWQPAGQSGGNRVTGFKSTQAEAMEHIRTRTKDVMVTLPTGEGKSVLFQIPALCRGLRNRRLTLVISPLKALMRDQVTRLHEQGFAESVDYISSDRPRFEQEDVLQGLLENRIVLLYVAPERLRNARFVDVLRRRIQADGGLEYVVFDEAHCINQWGYEFRPDYFFAFSFLMISLRDGTLQEPTPFLLLSATLTASDRRRIKGILERTARGDAILPLAVCPDPAAQGSPLRDHIKVSPRPMKGNIFDTQSFGNALEERLPQIRKVITQARANARATGQRSAVIIFVSRRAHADELANMLTRSMQCEVESYHAGLDAPTREDIYNRFRDGELDNLVATKAFGMGMDIPDIHWVVHLAPPSYLEDYLQEVGRIGRGAVERQKAGLRELDAVMLASPQDFENIRSQRAGNELHVPQVDEIEDQIFANAEILDGQKVAFVPGHGYWSYKTPGEKRANATRLRLALYWLETAGHIAQLGMVADLLTVTLHPSRLAQIASEEALHGRVAKAILGATQDEPEQKGVAADLLRRVSDTVGVRVRTLDNASIGDTNDAMINLSQVRRQCQIESMDATMSLIVELASLGALELQWTLEFAKRPMLSEEPRRIAALMTMVGNAVRDLLKRIKKTGELQFTPSQWFNIEALDLREPKDTESLSPREQAELDARKARFHRAFLNGFRTLARASGVRLKQGVQQGTEQIYWHARLPLARNRFAAKACDTLLAQAPSLLDVFLHAKDLKSIQVNSLIRELEDAHPDKTFRVADLEALLRLLSSLGLVSALPDLLPLSYLLLLRDARPGLGQHPELVEELNSVNELAGARIFAMEVFANLPDEARDRFIPGYFANASVDTLKDFLDGQLGEIEDESGLIAEKRDQLRATRATEFFERYKASEEPAQWQAMQHPFNRHLLVNAGPGAGKTSVLVGRIAHLIREQHVKPSEILVLAFNRAVVFEIRKRIRDLFRSLGYAAYASQVRVSTFHALAMRSLHGSDTPPKDASAENLLQEFAKRLAVDLDFRQDIAGQCRSLLIDEFQDVTEEVYAIIRRLYEGSGSQAGVMVIGDDDQDILRWNRKSGAARDGAFAELYFRRFQEDFGGTDLATLELGVNFRSGTEVVKKSQDMIQRFFDRNSRSSRLKTSLLCAAQGASDSRCERLDARGLSWDQMLVQVREVSLRLISENPGSIAILCRSNDEVASVHRALADAFPGLAVQNSENLSTRSLRHVALWIDFLEIEAARQDQALTDPLRTKLLDAFHIGTDIPETQRDATPEADLSILWDLCTQESSFPHLSTLIRFLKVLKSDDLQRLLGARHSEGEAVVSTIHKVKGLEYDNVIVMPSRTGFGSDAQDIDADAAEEARLLYVALTRAKSRLVYYVGDREYAWGRFRPERFEGANGQSQILTGTPKQVAIGWAMCRSAFNLDPDATQAYIETRVAVGDRLELGGRGAGANKGLFHRAPSGEKRQVGFIANNFGAGGPGSDLKVSAVIRYAAEESERDRQAASVAARGWGYVVLVEGMLR
ncbi:UvrD-helicase domain-containing protein [Limimaricola cinnabarinus]|uniref:DNA 3'-5' helicase n=1 Tax=Limimaricola cinnabarinus TaxID=1125964 RepID=A0A2G1MJ28_9RHOB|nr:UvrD-helicase domain-containing protein [Limimaricola cinnabarinus]PHP28697.1 hypothetical protein CJ301_05730 [Limimaricola cinnabarinus]